MVCLGSGFMLIENEIKMVKRDWKLPNLSYFTYISIVNLFYKQISYFTQFLGACFVPNEVKLKREKCFKNGSESIAYSLLLIENE